MKKWSLSQECMAALTFENQLLNVFPHVNKQEKHVIISIDTDKAFDKIQHSFLM